MMDLEKKLN